MAQLYCSLKVDSYHSRTSACLVSARAKYGVDRGLREPDLKVCFSLSATIFAIIRIMRKLSAAQQIHAPDAQRRAGDAQR